MCDFEAWTEELSVKASNLLREFNIDSFEKLENLTIRQLRQMGATTGQEIWEKSRSHIHFTNPYLKELRRLRREVARLKQRSS